MRLLHINASTRGADSRTLQIANEYLAALQEAHSSLQVDEINLDKTTLPDLSAATANAKYTAMAGQPVSDNGNSNWDLITSMGQNFKTYDHYLLSAPMWNFSIPYKLKHYIDVIMQPGVLFKFTEAGPEGLNMGKKMVCITTRGSDYSPEGVMKDFDFQEPYLRSIFGLAGMYDLQFINAQPLDYTPDLTQMVMTKAKEMARNIAMGKVASA